MRISTVTLSTTCPLCGKTYEVATVSADAYNAWQNGMLIQYAMPELSATERESLISGYCPDCQERIFGSNEDFEYDDEDYEEDEDDYYEEDEDDLDEDDYELFELDTEDDDEDAVDALAMLGALLGILSKS